MVEQQQVRSLTSQVEDAVTEAMRGVLPADVTEVDPLIRRSEHADLQSNAALSLAKRLKRNPRELAEEIRERLAEVPWLTAEVSGPGFLNLTVDGGRLVENLGARAEDPRLGVPLTQSGQVIPVDYSAPNVAKEMHVGHLRSTLIGDALARVLGYLGAEVIRQNHVGDWGTQFGMLIQYIVEHPDQRWHNDEVDTDRTGGAVSALDSLYRTARRTFDEDPEFKVRAQQRVVELQAGDEATLATWREIVTESEKAFQEVYARLGVLLELDDVAAESFYNPRLQGVVDELRELGVVQESEGAWCVFFDDLKGPDGTPSPLIVQKADGGFGYAATDLAAVRYRVQELAATRVLYVVDARQAQHFDMVFRTARRAGWLTDDIEVVHVQTGTINGPDGRPFKTRAGGTVRLADLLDEALRQAERVVREKDPELPDEELRRVAHTASIGAVKYAELSTARTKNYNFDVEQMVSFNGDTGVYLQYTHTRIASILRRAQDSPAAFDTSAELEPAERLLAWELDSFAEALDAVSGTLEPHRLAGYLYSLARAYTSFYEACPVLGAPTPEVRANRLALSSLARTTLATGLGLLGITAPDRM
ncbi:arginine--tRNA ligase [Streptomyces sp. AJS327]|uniref:arginine--tRNA ligase n=1 Tax=Streptomyces sp. AJS327 TaxID=2545265 RepID=UPI0015DEF80B|nr:arginine--tRNA ligase [Streptomyces sp. AJS327]MBA0053273.1 arginine--tRNA ligase [Streptomyces sp. AJS327]